MAIRQRPTSTAHRLLVTRLQGVAQRHSAWAEPDEQQRAAAVAELRAIGGDEDAYAESAGILIGCHPEGDPSHDWYRIAASYVLEAGGLTVEDEVVGEWIAIGEDRRASKQAAHRAGDTFDRPFGGQRK